MTEEEIQELIQNAFQKTAKELKENPDNVFNYLKLQEKYNEVLKDKVKLKRKNKQLKGVLNKIKTEIEEKVEFCKNESKGHMNHDKCDKTVLFLKRILDDLKEVL